MNVQSEVHFERLAGEVCSEESVTLLELSGSGNARAASATAARSNSAASDCFGQGTDPQRCTRAPPPFINFSTSSFDAIEVSPGVVMANAPCAAP